MAPNVAVYTGVFDPAHRGHLDMIQRGSKLFERLIIGVGINPEKQTLFSVDERVQLLQETLRPLNNIEVRAFTGLAVNFVRDCGARVMLRGLRTLSDMEYEFTMSLTNRDLAPEIETVFLMSKVEYSHISSSLLKQIASFKGDLEKFVTPEVRRALEAKMR
jgi:pantetheine-phosphate adenylyltransferase